MSEQPLVSIVIPCFNSEQTLDRALQSVLNQTYQNWEAIIVNDGSTDQTKKIIHMLKDKRIRYFEFVQNRGRAAARQKALIEARGKYLTMLDSDDWIFREKIHDQVTLMESHPEVKVMSGGIAIIDEGNELRGFRMGKMQVNQILELNKIQPPPIPHAVSIIRTEHAKKFGYNLNLKHSQDSDFLLKVMHKQKFMISDQVWYVYSELVSVNKTKILKSYYYTIKYFTTYLKSNPIQALTQIGIQLSKILYHILIRRFQRTKEVLLSRSEVPSEKLLKKFEAEREFLENSLNNNEAFSKV
jgi:glycosyltransferase involved in cell wall biosynthesis